MSGDKFLMGNVKVEKDGNGFVFMDFSDANGTVICESIINTIDYDKLMRCESNSIESRIRLAQRCDNRPHGSIKVNWKSHLPNPYRTETYNTDELPLIIEYAISKGLSLNMQNDENQPDLMHLHISD